jgi:hypothetical protein
MSTKTPDKTTQRFRTKLLRGGKTATGLEVPEKVIEALGGGKRAKVRVTVNRYTYRTSIGVMGGKVLVGVSAEVRATAGIAAGDMVDVTLALDSEPRKVQVPQELAKALASSMPLKKRFDGLSFSKRQALALPIERGKTPETRQRNLAKALDALRQMQD